MFRRGNPVRLFKHLNADVLTDCIKVSLCIRSQNPTDVKLLNSKLRACLEVLNTKVRRPFLRLFLAFLTVVFPVSRQDLVPWLQQQIAEQRKIDFAASGVDKELETSIVPSTSIASIHNIISDVQVVLPGDGAMKKQRRQTVKLFQDRGGLAFLFSHTCANILSSEAYETKVRIKNAMQTGGMPMIAVDMPPAAFDSISRNNQWLTDDDAWRCTIAGFFAQQTVYVNQIRDIVLRKKEEGAEFVLLFSVKEERVSLLSL